MKLKHFEYICRMAEQRQAEVLAVSEDMHTGEMLVVLDERVREVWGLHLTTITAEEFYSSRYFTDEQAAMDAFGSEHNGR